MILKPNEFKIKLNTFNSDIVIHNLGYFLNSFFDINLGYMLRELPLLQLREGEQVFHVEQHH